jgi:hypothetical protein
MDADCDVLLRELGINSSIYDPRAKLPTLDFVNDLTLSNLSAALQETRIQQQQQASKNTAQTSFWDDDPQLHFDLENDPLTQSIGLNSSHSSSGLRLADMVTKIVDDSDYGVSDVSTPCNMQPQDSFSFDRLAPHFHCIS